MSGNLESVFISGVYPYTGFRLMEEPVVGHSPRVVSVLPRKSNKVDSGSCNPSSLFYRRNTRHM